MSNMRVLFLRQRFEPEPTFLRGLDYVRELAHSGVDVEVLTGFPFYPGTAVYNGYKQRLHHVEVLDEITVHRNPLVVGHASGALRRLASFATLPLTATFNALRLRLQADAVMTTLGPGTYAVAALLLAKCRRAALILDVQDLWPESLHASGMWPRWATTKPIEFWLRVAYRHADLIICLSPGCRDLLIERGADPESTFVHFNWPPKSEPTPAERDIATQLIADVGGPGYLCYTGSLGPIQGVDIMIRALQRAPSMRLVVVGAGRADTELRELASELGDRVVFTGQQPPAVAAILAENAAACVLHLRPSPLDTSAIPSKFAAYARAGVPIVVAAHGETAALATDVGCGPVIEPSDVESMAGAFREVGDASAATATSWGERARTFFDDELDFTHGVARIGGRIRALRP